MQDVGQRHAKISNRPDRKRPLHISKNMAYLEMQPRASSIPSPRNYVRRVKAQLLGSKCRLNSMFRPQLGPRLMKNTAMKRKSEGVADLRATQPRGRSSVSRKTGYLQQTVGGGRRRTSRSLRRAKQRLKASSTSKKKR